MSCDNLQSNIKQDFQIDVMTSVATYLRSKVWLAEALQNLNSTTTTEVKDIDFFRISLLYSTREPRGYRFGVEAYLPDNYNNWAMRKVFLRSDKKGLTVIDILD